MTSPTVTGIACRLVTSCLSHISKASKIKQEKAKYQSFIAHEFGRFKLWVHGFDAPPSQSDESDGGLEAVNNQLDKVLGYSKYLKEPTILLLSSFASCLLTKCFIRVGDSTTRIQLENALKDAIEIYPHIEDDCDFRSDLSKRSAMEELHEIVDTLYELAPALHDVFQKVRAPKDLGLPPVIMSYKNFIHDKFPNARGDLILRFAEGNTECYEKLRSPVSKSSGAQEISQRPTQIGSNVNPASLHDSGLGSSLHPTTISAKGPYAALSPINESLGQTKLLTIPQGPSSVSALTFPAHSEHTAFSATSAKGNRPSTPRMPNEENWRTGFKCPLCSAQQRGIRNKRQWRTHVFCDLRPYMCIYGVCTAGKQSFPSKREWIAHHNSHKSDNDGSGVETCPFCLKEFESNWARFYSHVAHHMEDIRLLSLPPSQRQSDDPGVDDMSLGNSSCTNSEYIQSTKRSKNSVVLGRGSREEAPGNSMKQQLKAYKQPSKAKLVGDWLSRSTSYQEVETDEAGIEEVETDKVETNQVVESEKKPKGSIVQAESETGQVEREAGEEGIGSTLGKQEQGERGNTVGHDELKELDDMAGHDERMEPDDTVDRDEQGGEGEGSLIKSEKESKADTMVLEIEEQWDRKALEERGDKPTAHEVTFEDLAFQAQELERNETALRKLYSDLAEHNTPSGDLLTATLTMASSFEKQGNYENALEWFGRALVGRQMTLGEDHLDTLSTIHSIALVHEKKGMYTEALEGLQRVLAGQERALGKDHPNTLSTVHKVASIFVEKVEYDDTLELFRRALAGREKSLATGKGHSSTLSIVNEMASVFRKQGEYEKALMFYKLVLLGKERILGEDHSDMLLIVHEMASVSAQLGKYDNAKKWFEQALAGREKVLGEYHPDTLTTVHNMATLFAEQKQYNKALTLYERVLAGEEKADNKNHAKILITVHNMASIFRKQKEYDNALEWYQRLLTRRVEMLGEYHPDTLSTVHNMASVFRKQGKNDEARSWYERALEGREKTLGKDHPSTKHTKDRILALG